MKMDCKLAGSLSNTHWYEAYINEAIEWISFSLIRSPLWLDVNNAACSPATWEDSNTFSSAACIAQLIFFSSSMRKLPEKRTEELH